MRESGGSGASGTMASQNATAVAITGGTSAAAPTKTTMSAYVFSDFCWSLVQVQV